MVDLKNIPLKMKSDYAAYADKHEIFTLFTNLLRRLIIDKPRDPLVYLLECLEDFQSLEPFNIFIIGAPGSGKQSLAHALSYILGLVYIDPIKTMKNYLIENTKESAHRKVPVSSVRLSPHIAAQAIAHRLQQGDCRSRGWVIPGFPKNCSQAIELAAKGFYPEHVVILEVSDEIAIQRAQVLNTSSFFEDLQLNRNASDPNTIQRIMRMLNTYRRCCWEIVDLFGKQTVKKIDAEKPFNTVLSEVYDFLRLRPFSLIPFTPRILLLGPPGCGRTIQAIAICAKYNLVNINYRELVLREVQEHERKRQPITTVNIPKLSDEEAVELISTRLLSEDCIKKGWVMHNFPENTMQAYLFYKAGFYPNRVIVFDLTDDVCIERVRDRQVDPMTGNWYHPKFNPPPSANIAERLVVHPDDKHHHLVEVLAQYRRYEETLGDIFPVSQHIDASKDSYSIFEQVENIVLRPNPRKLEPIESLMPMPVKKESSFILVNYHLHPLDIDFVDFDD